MIPLKLELRNFMAYRECDPLDFSGLHTVVLTGDNGAGKSTLLDAITWAIWGYARARRDDELISQGESEMRVSLTFSEGRNVYRAVRTRKLGKATAKTKAPASTGTLDFLIEDAGSWRTLSEPRASDTQAKIERTLNLSYDTFINSAYLKQGRADEFTLKTPAERKTLLAEILSLDVWQDYERRFKEQLDAATRDENLRQVRLNEMEAEIGRLPDYERELESAHQNAAVAQSQMAAIEAELAELNRLRERERLLAAQIGAGEARARLLRADLDRLAEDGRGHQKALEAYESALAQREDIERGYARFLAAQAEIDALNLKLSSMVELNARKSRAEAEIAEARRAIESDRDGALRRISELERLADDAALRGQFLEISRELEALTRDQRALAEAGAAAVTVREDLSTVRAQNDELRRKMFDLDGRIKAIERVGAVCPTCGRELPDSDRARLLADWRADGKAMGDEFRRNSARVEELQASRRAAEERIAELESAQRRMPAVQREHSAIEERLAQASAAASQLPPVRENLRAVEARLAAGGYAPAARTELDTVLAELGKLGYDGARHAELRAELPALRAFADRKLQLDKAEIGVQAERRGLEALELRAAAARGQLESATAEIERERSASAEIRQQLQRAPAVEAAHQRVRNDFFAAQRKVGEANQKVQACKALESARVSVIRELEQLRKRQSLLIELRDASGKNGVPALIVETVLPQLEASANDLIGRMSNGRMNVRFETQRATQAGTLSETLDLRISDELGERSYEMFSGGEAFRVNFAVRIALSKLLAHRAGAQLQTLFIDEGFGTQDAQGRERLVEAIRAIESDFSRVFVITHIDELRDAFPARIEVAKTASGSTARVV